MPWTIQRLDASTWDAFAELVERVRDESRIMLFARMDQTHRAFWFLGPAT